MKISGSSFLKGLAVGAAAGTAIGVLTAPHRRDMRRTVGKFLKTAGSIVEDFIDCYDLRS
jgi:gas vesicle protein